MTTNHQNKNSIQSSTTKKSFSAILFVAVMGALMVATPSLASLGRVTTQLITPTPAVETAQPEVELPDRWKWERKAITFDHMYRNKR